MSDEMEKYSVVIDEDHTKVGEPKSAPASCPDCGAPLDTNTNVPKCPVHGTRPFEPEKKR